MAATSTATATDDVGVVGVSYWSGSLKLGEAVRRADGAWQLTFDTLRYPNGAYSVVARARDAAGNVGQSAPHTVVIRN